MPQLVTTSPPPPPPASYKAPVPWGHVGLGLGIAAALGLAGYGVFTWLSNVSGNKAADACTQELQQLTTLFATTYHGFIQQNRGAPLTQQQEDSLGAIGTQMDSAQACVQSAVAYQEAQVTTAVTNIALIAAGTVGAVAALSVYLRYRGRLLTTVQARAAIRNSVAQTAVDAGKISSSDGAAAVQQTAAAAENEAAKTSVVLSAQARTDLAAAEKAADESLLTRISNYVSVVIDTIVSTLTEVYDFFYVLLA